MKIDSEKIKALVETLKSIGRGLYFTILGLIGVALVALAGSPEVLALTITVAGFTVNIGTIIAAAIAFLAKIIDTYIHKNDAIDSNGIAPSFLQK